MLLVAAAGDRFAAAGDTVAGLPCGAFVAGLRDRRKEIGGPQIEGNQNKKQGDCAGQRQAPSATPGVECRCRIV